MVTNIELNAQLTLIIRLYNGIHTLRNETYECAYGMSRKNHGDSIQFPVQNWQKTIIISWSGFVGLLVLGIHFLVSASKTVSRYRLKVLLWDSIFS